MEIVSTIFCFFFVGRPSLSLLRDHQMSSFLLLPPPPPSRYYGDDRARSRRVMTSANVYDRVVTTIVLARGGGDESGVGDGDRFDRFHKEFHRRSREEEDSPRRSLSCAALI